MTFWLEILIGAVFLLFAYFVFRVVLILFAEHELDASAAANRKDDAIEIFAEADSLEYYLRLALAAANGTIAVVAYVKKDSADRTDMLDTIEKLKRTHKNLSYRLI